MRTKTPDGEWLVFFVKTRNDSGRKSYGLVLVDLNKGESRKYPHCVFGYVEGNIQRIWDEYHCEMYHRDGSRFYECPNCDFLDITGRNLFIKVEWLVNLICGENPLLLLKFRN
jgi:hypothetical protein